MFYVFCFGICCWHESLHYDFLLVSACSMSLDHLGWRKLVSVSWHQRLKKKSQKSSLYIFRVDTMLEYFFKSLRPSSQHILCCVIFYEMTWTNQPVRAKNKTLPRPSKKVVRSQTMDRQTERLARFAHLRWDCQGQIAIIPWRMAFLIVSHVEVDELCEPRVFCLLAVCQKVSIT